MEYDELLKSRRIRKEKASRIEVERALEHAERDLQRYRRQNKNLKQHHSLHNPTGYAGIVRFGSASATVT